MSSLVDMDVKDLLALTGSKAPAPGGGSMSALAAAMASQLGKMVYQLTEGKKVWQKFADDLKEEMALDFSQLTDLAFELEILVDEDTKAFNSFMTALALPKESKEDIRAREKALQDASILAMEIPLRVAKKSLEVICHLKSIALFGNKNSLSDAGVALHLAAAAVEGAALNVRINLPGIDDEKIKSKALQEIKDIGRGKNDLLNEILAAVEQRMDY